MTHTDAAPVRITGWDRAAIVTLGGAGCALSYDALQQMAVAIHIRGLLTYLFPFVIDGFIGYGVRAVLVMRSASLGARCYVWALFGTATAASIWANALHAVRLNDHLSGDGLRLGDVTVGVLSTLAPLALAGAVHLYILIARRAGQPGHKEAAIARETVSVRTERGTVVPDSRSGRGVPGSQAAVRPVTGQQSSALSAGVSARPMGIRPDVLDEEPVTAESEPVSASKGALEQGRRNAAPSGEPGTRCGHTAPTDVPDPEGTSSAAAAEVDDLLRIARRAVADTGKLTRKVVADAVRGQRIPLSNDRLTELMQQLRAEADNRTLRSTG